MPLRLATAQWCCDAKEGLSLWRQEGILPPRHQEYAHPLIRHQPLEVFPTLPSVDPAASTTRPGSLSSELYLDLKLAQAKFLLR
jgi:hypothetical protein